MSSNQSLPYIHLVVDRLMNLGGAGHDSDKAVSPEGKSEGLIARDFGTEEWDWPRGVGLYGLLKLQNFYRNERYLEFLKNQHNSNLKRELPSRNISTTAPYLTLAYLLDVLDSPEYEELYTRQTRWLMTEMPRTSEGDSQYVTSITGGRNGVILNDGELWIDTLFIAVLFLNKMGQHYGEKEWVSESIHQVLLHIKYLYEKKSGLFYRGFSFPLGSNFGGISQCRGDSRFTVGIMDYLGTFQNSLGVELSAYLVDTYRAQVQTLKELQSPPGLWHTVLTDPTSYEEVSGFAAVTAGILRGLELGILDETYRPCAQNIVEIICRDIGEDGTVKNVSAGVGMGYDAQHYKGIAITLMAYGQSLTLLALCEALT